MTILTNLRGANNNGESSISQLFEELAVNKARLVRVFDVGKPNAGEKKELESGMNALSLFHEGV